GGVSPAPVCCNRQIRPTEPPSATMPTPVLTVDQDLRAIHRAAELIRSGGLVAFPTETVYGLGANALVAGAVARVFQSKGRPAKNPLIVHVADESRVGQVTGEWPDSARKLAEAFWPGPLSIVVPKHPALPIVVTSGGPTVAVRSPANPVA